MKKQILTYIVVVLVAIGVIVGGFYGYQALTSKKSEPTVTTTNTCDTSNNGKTITYKGEDGTTALAMLQKNCQTESSGQGESSFITKINGVEANSSKEFWSFKVNGEMASVGAGSYTTKSSETITWELSPF